MYGSRNLVKLRTSWWNFGIKKESRWRYSSLKSSPDSIELYQATLVLYEFHSNTTDASSFKERYRIVFLHVVSECCSGVHCFLCFRSYQKPLRTEVCIKLSLVHVHTVNKQDYLRATCALVVSSYYFGCVTGKRQH